MAKMGYEQLHLASLVINVRSGSGKVSVTLLFKVMFDPVTHVGADRAQYEAIQSRSTTPASPDSGASSVTHGKT